MRGMTLALATCVVCSLADGVSAQKPFKNATAAAAQKDYEKAIAKARADYIAKLDQAKQETRKAGDLQEANLIAAAKQELTDPGASEGPDPVEQLRKRLEGTRWGPERSQAIALQPKNKVVFANGVLGTWTLPDTKTLILQSNKSGNIAVWKFDGKVFKVYRFRQIKESPSINRMFR